MFWWQGDCWLSQPDLNQTSECGVRTVAVTDVSAGAVPAVPGSSSGRQPAEPAMLWLPRPPASPSPAVLPPPLPASSPAPTPAPYESAPPALRAHTRCTCDLQTTWNWCDYMKLPLLIGTLKLKLVYKWMIFFSLAIHRAYTLLCVNLCSFTHIESDWSVSSNVLKVQHRHVFRSTSLFVKRIMEKLT